MGEIVALGIRIVQGWRVGATCTWIMTPSLVHLEDLKTSRLEDQEMLFLHYGPGCKPSGIFEALKAVGPQDAKWSCAQRSCGAESGPHTRVRHALRLSVITSTSHLIILAFVTVRDIVVGTLAA